jgi:hypothetical protein
MGPRGGGRSRTIPEDADLSGPHLYLPTAVVAETERLLRSYGGEEDHEGVIYFGGAEIADGAIAMLALSPTATTTRGSFQTDIDANTEVVRSLGELNLSLVGQVHSHPGHWVDHSNGDDEGALVRFDGYWSLVVPAFAHAGMRPLKQCGVHLFREGKFKRLTEAAIGARLHLVPTAIDLRRR